MSEVGKPRLDNPKTSQDLWPRIPKSSSEKSSMHKTRPANQEAPGTAQATFGTGKNALSRARRKSNKARE
jgi:hypothetical protein